MRDGRFLFQRLRARRPEPNFHHVRGHYRAYFAEARWHEFPSAGHFPELEDPERFAKILHGFVATL